MKPFSPATMNDARTSQPVVSSPEEVVESVPLSPSFQAPPVRGE